VVSRSIPDPAPHGTVVSAHGRLPDRYGGSPAAGRQARDALRVCQSRRAEPGQGRGWPGQPVRSGRGRATGPTGTAAAACRGRGHHHRVGHHRDHRRHPPLPRPRRDRPRGPPHLRRRRRTALDRRVPRPGQGAGGRQGTVAGEARGAGRGPGRAGRAASRDAAARAAPGYRAGDGRDRSAPAPTRPIGRARGWTEHHRGHGGLPAPARHFDNFGPIRINNPNGNFRLGRSR
jgi:hypothetical protein